MRATASALLAACAMLLLPTACAPRGGRRARPTPAPQPLIAPAARWGYVGGQAVARADAEVKNTQDKALYLTERYSMSAYRIPMAKGACSVKLHFAETYEGIKQAGQRVFTVALEGKPVLPDLDVFREAGNQSFAAIVKEFAVEVKDGELTIEFTPKVQNPMINAIEVRALRQGRPAGAALLINCGAAADYEAKDGRIWRRDQEYAAP